MNNHELSNSEIIEGKLIEKAEQLENEGCFSEALLCWRTLFKHNPDPVFLFHCGRLAMEIKEWVEAEQAFLSAIDLDPDLYIAYHGLAILYEKQDNLEKAQEYLKKCLEINQSADAFTILGSVQKRLSMILEARESFGKALQIDPNYEEALYNLALTFTDEHPDKAIDLLTKAIEIDPKYSYAHRELGWLLLQRDKYTDAEYHIRKTIELDNSDVWAYVYLGNLMWKKDELKDAEEAFKIGIKIWPDESLPHWCLAHFYECQDRREEARVLYERALELDPDDPSANLRFGLFLKGIGELEKARAHLERVLNIDPDNEHVKQVLSRLK
ncbi:MAG: tetratricopeptide repeat protein [Acidobacteriota bacterium]